MTPLPPSAGRALTLAEQRLHDVRAAAASCATLGVDLARVEAEARIGWEGVAAHPTRPVGAGSRPVVTLAEHRPGGAS